MRNIYVDESIHERGGFIVIAAVAADACMDASVKEALARNGLRAGIDEFKSSGAMAGDPRLRRVRDELKQELMFRCKVAFAVCAPEERSMIMPLVGGLIRTLPENVRSAPATVRFDEGMVVTPIELPPGWSVEHGCDSRGVAGIQLADLAAHMVSTIILGQLGLVTKMVSTEGGYPEPEVELAWELWSSIRHAMASGRPCFAPIAALPGSQTE